MKKNNFNFNLIELKFNLHNPGASFAYCWRMSVWLVERRQMAPKCFFVFFPRDPKMAANDRWAFHILTLPRPLGLSGDLHIHHTASSFYGRRSRERPSSPPAAYTTLTVERICISAEDFRRLFGCGHSSRRQAASDENWRKVRRCVKNCRIESHGWADQRSISFAPDVRL